MTTPKKQQLLVPKDRAIYRPFARLVIALILVFTFQGWTLAISFTGAEMAFLESPGWLPSALSWASGTPHSPVPLRLINMAALVLVAYLAARFTERMAGPPIGRQVGSFTGAFVLIAPGLSPAVVACHGLPSLLAIGLTLAACQAIWEFAFEAEREDLAGTRARLRFIPGALALVGCGYLMGGIAPPVIAFFLAGLLNGLSLKLYRPPGEGRTSDAPTETRIAHRAISCSILVALGCWLHFKTGVSFEPFNLAPIPFSLPLLALLVIASLMLEERRSGLLPCLWLAFYLAPDQYEASSVSLVCLDGLGVLSLCIGLALACTGYLCRPRFRSWSKFSLPACALLMIPGSLSFAKSHLAANQWRLALLESIQEHSASLAKQPVPTDLFVLTSPAPTWGQRNTDPLTQRTFQTDLARGLRPPFSKSPVQSQPLEGEAALAQVLRAHKLPSDPDSSSEPGRNALLVLTVNKGPDALQEPLIPRDLKREGWAVRMPHITRP